VEIVSMAFQMADRPSRHGAVAVETGSLRTYYLTRAVVAAVWAAAAFSIGDVSAIGADLLLVAYPAWDALANLLDVERSGGFGANKLQTANIVFSASIAAAVAASLGTIELVIGIFGGWAILAGVLQLAVGVRRWRFSGAQWAMVLSGAQSALAGGFFIKQALGTMELGVRTVAPYAAFGAFYFLVSAVALTFRRKR
jgi:hypothetical protein